MRRGLPLLTLTVLLAGGFAPGAEQQHQAQLEQARQLRNQKQPQDALAILQQLAKDPPESLVTVLPVELARTRVQLAMQQEIVQRPAYLLKARAELTALIKDPKTGDPAAILEAARIDVLIGTALAQQSR